MAVYSAARWIEPDDFDGRIGYIELSSDSYGSFVIEHYYEGEAPEEASGSTLHTFASILEPVGGRVYRYAIPAETTYEDGSSQWVEVIDRWKLFEDGVLVVDYKADATEYWRDFFEPPPKVEIPTDNAEKRVIKNSVYRLWAHYPWTPFQRKVSTANAVPSGLNGAFYTYTVANDRLFADCFLPTVSERSAIESIMEGEAVDLFESSSGKAYYLPKEKKVVIPLSDGTSKWTEEYAISNYLTASVNWVVKNGNTSLFTPTQYSILTEVGELTFDVGLNHTSSYNSTDIPGSFATAITAIENSMADSTVQIPKWNLGDGSGKGFMVDGVGGVIYDSDNFITI